MTGTTSNVGTAAMHNFRMHTDSRPSASTRWLATSECKPEFSASRPFSRPNPYLNPAPKDTHSQPMIIDGT
jgi:hypothetical protein